MERCGGGGAQNLRRTRPGIIQNELLRREELWRPSTVAEIHGGLEEVVAALDSLQVFDSVAFAIEPSQVPCIPPSAVHACMHVNSGRSGENYVDRNLAWHNLKNM